MTGRSGAAQPKMAAGSPTGRLTLTNGLHGYIFIYGLWFDQPAAFMLKSMNKSP